MTVRVRHGLAFALVAVLGGCLPGGSPRGATPARSTRSLVREIEARHAAILDAIRYNRPERIQANLAPDAVLVLRSGDTIRDPAIIARTIAAFGTGLTIQSTRVRPADRVSRCLEGVVEELAEWTIQVVQPDSSTNLRRSSMGAYWTASGDSLRLRLVDMSFDPRMSVAKARCTPVDSIPWIKGRLAVFAAFGATMPMSYDASARDAYGREGFSRPRSSFATEYPRSERTEPPTITGLSLRVSERVWLTATAPNHRQNDLLGFSNLETRVYVNINRQHYPMSITADYRWKPALAFGIGPSVATDRWFYQEVRTDAVCPAGVGVQCPVYRDTRNVVNPGFTATAELRSPMASHIALLARLQTFWFPTERFPALATGQDVRVSDFTTVLGWGFRFTY